MGVARQVHRFGVIQGNAGELFEQLPEQVG